KTGAFCRGMPAKNQPTAAKGMYPLPPQLFEKDEMLTGDPAGETYWTVSNGIRMTGMPGFGEMLTPTQMWQVSLLLAKADKLPPPVQSTLTKAGATPPSTPNPAPPSQPARKKN